MTMGRSAKLLVFVVAILLVGSGSYAKMFFLQHGVQGPLPPPQIASASIDCGTSCGYVGGVPSGTPIGNLNATLFPGTWSVPPGSWSTSGTDGTKFSAVGTQLQTNATTPGCSSTPITYSLNIVASQSGVSNSPFAKPITVTCNPPASFVSASISCGSSCSYNSGSLNAAIGTASATLTSGTFTGSWSTSGTSGAAFSFNGNTLQTNSSTPPCSSITSLSLNIVATQAGVGGSPKSQAITVTCNPANLALSIASGGRYLQKSGAPFLLVGDSAWNMQTIANVAPVAGDNGNNIQNYINIRSGQGFNAFFLVYACEAPPYGNCTNPVQDGAGNPPFNAFLGGCGSTVPDCYDMSSSYNTAFWQRLCGTGAADGNACESGSIVGRAAAAGMYVMIMIPQEYAGTDGPWNMLVNNGGARVNSFGQFVASIFKNQWNVIWCLGDGDFQIWQSGGNSALVASFAAGLRAGGDNHVITSELNYFNSVVSDDTSSGGIGSASNVNGVYTYYPAYEAVTHAYNANAGPVVITESLYDQSSGVTQEPGVSCSNPYGNPTCVYGAAVRKQYWWMALSGGVGYFYGYNNLGNDFWYTAPYGLAYGGRPGDFANVWRTIITGQQWQNLVPDQTASVLTNPGSRYSPGPNYPDYNNCTNPCVTGNTYSTAAYANTAAGATVIAYSPGNGPSGYSGSNAVNALTINMASFGSGTITATWYDPTNGAASSAGTGLTNSGTHTFTPSGTNAQGDTDWVLVITGPQASVSFVSASISCGSGCAYNSTDGSGTPIGTASATLSNGTFTGSWSTSGTDGAKFSFAGSTLQTNGNTVACGSTTTYHLNIVATQAGIGGSPFSQAITVTCNPSTGIQCAFGPNITTGVPAAAAAAGFTTCAANYDFSQPMWATVTGPGGWLGCSYDNNPPASQQFQVGAGGQQWSADCPGVTAQVFDPAAGKNVLRMGWVAGSHCNTFNPGCEVIMSTVTSSGQGSFHTIASFPLFYYEAVARMDRTYCQGCTGQNIMTGSVWATELADPSAPHQELDVAELTSGNAYSAAGDGAGNYEWWFSDWSTNYVPAGYAITDYHTYATLTTGTTSDDWECGYVDNIFQGFVTTGSGAGQGGCGHGIMPELPFDRVGINLDVYAGEIAQGATYDLNMYVEYIHIFTCPNWQPGTGPDNGQCHGTVLHTGANGLGYYSNPQ